MSLEDLVGKTIIYTWGDKQLEGKVTKIKHGTIQVIDVT